MVKNEKSLYHSRRFSATVISCAVRWYFRFQLSLRDIEELLSERGVIVGYETERRCNKFGACSYRLAARVDTWRGVRRSCCRGDSFEATVTGFSALCRFLRLRTFCADRCVADGR